MRSALIRRGPSVRAVLAVLCVLAPVAAIILLFTVVGWVPAAVLLAAYVGLLVFASPVAALVATSVLLRVFKQSRTDLKWYHILVGLVVLNLLAFIPLVGWLAWFVIYLVSFGAVAEIVKTKFAAQG